MNYLYTYELQEISSTCISWMRAKIFYFIFFWGKCVVFTLKAQAIGSEHHGNLEVDPDLCHQEHHSNQVSHLKKYTPHSRNKLHSFRYRSVL